MLGSSAREFITALAYFSVLPVGKFSAGGPPSARALAMLPLVGILIGAIAGGGAALISAFEPRLAPAVAITLTLWLTGAIHLDGYLDSCDALIASVTPVRRLEILKDPRHGTFALAGLLGLSVLWMSALSILPWQRLPSILAWTACTARWAAVFNARVFPYAPGGAAGTAFAEQPPVAVLAITGIGIYAVGLTAFAHWQIGIWPVFAQLIALFLGRWASRRLGGGLVGDVYGAIICILDVLGIAVFSIRG